MFSAALDILDLEPQHNYIWGGITLLLGLIIYIAQLGSPINAIPAIGKTGLFTSYFSALLYVKHAPVMLQEGYDRYKSKVFRVPGLRYWNIIVSDEKLVEELRKVSDDRLSIEEAGQDVLGTDYFIGKNARTDPYHIGIIRAQLTRNLQKLYPDVRDEVIQAFDDNIPVTEDWVKVRVLDTAMRVVSRVSNRVFVGTPTCRTPEYTTLCIQFAVDVFAGTQIIKLFPNFIKPLAIRVLTNVPKAIETGYKHLKLIIEERRRKIEEYGVDYPDKPNDMLSWLMDSAKGEELSTENLTRRILVLNIAAIHTSSMSFAHALYNLATYPEHIEPLRAEIEAVIAEDGWSKASVGRMHKLDSFLKECQRLTPLDDLPIRRIAIKPYTFSDGTYVPQGSMVSAMLARHRDEKIYPRANVFDGFRFENKDGEDGAGIRNQFAATSAHYLPFGHGRHACPGRFFAANQLKTMMAHLLITYDFKLERPGVRPMDEYFNSGRIPNRRAEMFFRKRKV